MPVQADASKTGIATMTHEEWTAEATRRFGPDPMGWRFVCPVCGHVASVRDWKDAGAPESAVAFSCVGRWSGGKGSMMQKIPEQPCDYAGGGLFRLNPVIVTRGEETHHVFAFANP